MIKQINYLIPMLLVEWALDRMALQEELLEARAEIIALHKRIEAMTPITPPDEVLWHIQTGMLSEEAAESDDAVLVRKFLNWNNDFARTYLKPYLNPKVYMETLGQMARGLPQRVAALEWRDECAAKEKRRAALVSKSQEARQN